AVLCRQISGVKIKWWQALNRFGGVVFRRGLRCIAARMDSQEEPDAMTESLQDIARRMVTKGKGILAADESSGTIRKRFDTIGLESTADSRRDYRELLFRSAEAMRDCISGVILYDETIRQSAKDGTPFVEIIKAAGAIPGIKVDAGAKPLAG